MDTIQLPGPLPATVTRPRPLIEAVMAQSVREQGPAQPYGAGMAMGPHRARTISGQPGTRYRRAAQHGRHRRRSTPRQHAAGVRLAAVERCPRP